MTAKELIEKLQQYDGDMTVFSFIGLEVTNVYSAPLNYLYDNPKDQIIVLE